MKYLKVKNLFSGATVAGVFLLFAIACEAQTSTTSPVTIMAGKEYPLSSNYAIVRTYMDCKEMAKHYKAETVSQYIEKMQARDASQNTSGGNRSIAFMVGGGTYKVIKIEGDCVHIVYQGNKYPIDGWTVRQWLLNDLTKQQEHKNAGSKSP